MNDVNYKKKRIVRVIVNFRNGTNSVGTGFFISRSGNLLTCAHVILGLTLTQLRANNTFISTSGATEAEKITNYQRNETISIQVQLPNGVIINADLEKLNADFDIGLLRLTGENPRVDFFEINHSASSKFDYDDNVFFCGFQEAVGYTNLNFPFSVNSGIVSTFPTVTVTGTQYEHVQVNSINLGGNSGAPLFKKGSNVVEGIINGNMNWGSDTVLQVANGIVAPAPLRTPLSIAYATPLSFIKHKTAIFN